MFKREKFWVLSTFQTGDNNIQFDDKDYNAITNSSTLLIKGKKYKLGVFANALVNFKFNLQFKEGKYKFRLDNLIIKTMGIENYPVAPYGVKIVGWKKYNEYLIEEINKSFVSLTSSLESEIKGTSNTKKDDW